MKKNMMLDAEEQQILTDFENGVYVKDTTTDLKLHAEYARNTLKKDARINIRISARDLDALQRKAVREGLPYQSLIGSVLHKFANGYLQEAK